MMPTMWAQLQWIIIGLPLISLLTPTPMYKKVPTLSWSHVQTCRRREKVCPQYCVFGLLGGSNSNNKKFLLSEAEHVIYSRRRLIYYRLASTHTTLFPKCKQQ